MQCLEISGSFDARWVECEIVWIPPVSARVYHDVKIGHHCNTKDLPSLILSEHSLSGMYNRLFGLPQSPLHRLETRNMLEMRVGLNSKI